MKLKEKLLRGIYAYGFERPSAIQQRAILPCIMGHDVIAQAQSGTGKTATFAISLLQQIDIELNECQALVLAPTRELAQQIQKVLKIFFFFSWMHFFASLSSLIPGCLGSWRLHGCPMSRLHWWYKRPRGSPQALTGCSRCCWNAGSRLRHDQSAGAE